MAEFPFELVVKVDSSNNAEETLTCIGLLRAVPGRRRVYDATWNGRGVIAKVFSHKISADRHLRREWRGLASLQKRRANSPEPLFSAKTEDGLAVAVTEKILNCSTALEILEKAANLAVKTDILIAVCMELADHHTKGILQKDLHLGNFLLAGKKVFVLDPAQMRFLPHPVSKKKSISQLAMLACYLSSNQQQSLERLYRQYARQRSWAFDKSDLILFKKQYLHQKARGIAKGLRKCLRTSKRCLRINSGRYVGVFDRTFCRNFEPAEFAEQIDTLMDNGQILKDGNTSYVSRIKFNDTDVVIKRYNNKGFIHSLRHTIKRCRARRGWLWCHRLGMLDISAPRPLAYIEQRKKFLVWKSYLLTEYLAGQSLYDFLRDRNITAARHCEVLGQIEELLDSLGDRRITHGDLKHTNILITDTGPAIIDTDSMQTHRCGWLFKIKRAKDLARLANISRG